MGRKPSVRGSTGLDSSLDGAADKSVQNIQQMLFSSSSGLLDANKNPLTTDSLVAVWSEPTATMNDRDGNGDVVTYPDGDRIPLVCIDESKPGAVVGIGAPFVDDGSLVPELESGGSLGDLGNEEFLLNIYDAYVAKGTILWDESHSQFYDLASYTNFEAYVENDEYSVDATSDLQADLPDARAVVITSPGTAFSDAELTALSEFVDNGGLVVLHDQSDFNDFDNTEALNTIASSLGVGFRFNDGEVADEENNVGVPRLLLTTQFNSDEFLLFSDRPGITVDLQAGTEYEVTVDSVADGDTCDVVFKDDVTGLGTNYRGTVRVLGIDTPESAGVAQSAERPEEWEGLAYDLGAVDPIDELVFDSTSSLLDASKSVLTDDSLVTVSAEPSAYNSDTDGDGDAVSYPGDTDIPLVAIDGTVVGLGAPFITDDEFSAQADNEEFMLNVYDSVIDGDTILWDEGHGQFYTLSSASAFESYAESEGYTMQTTTDIAADLSSADAVIVVSPGSFSSSELTALSEFVDNGGAVFLHDQSDFNNFDNTASLNAIATELGVGFRFNDDQVFDNENNTGNNYVPTTANFDSSSSLFETRQGIDDDPDARTNAYLTSAASDASTFATSELDGKDATLFFDENESIRDPTRLLAYLRYDSSGDGTRDTLYNKAAVEEGYARAYGSGLSKHEEFWQAEKQARDQNKRVWSESDLTDASPYRERIPETLFFPVTSSVAVPSGADRVVYAASDATQQETDDPVAGQIPLFARDDATRTAVAGSLLVDESYERLEGFAADTSSYDNYQFVTNALETLTTQNGPVYIDGGHGQFGTDYGLSSEDAAYYQRHLEGRQTNLEQINDLTLDRLGDASALIITTPDTALSSAELSAVESFRDDGGAVILLGSADAPDAAVQQLNDVANALGTDLRVNTDRVVDGTNNVAGDADIPVVTLDTGPALQKNWSQQTGSGTVAGQLQFSSPAVDNARLYVGGLDEFVTAHARGDGTADWTVERAGSLSDSSPVIHAGTLYVGDGGGRLHAIDAASGTVNWTYDTGTDAAGPASAVTSTPAVFEAGQSVWVVFGSNDGVVHAVTDDGAGFTPQWTQDVGAAVYSDIEAGSVLGSPWAFVTTDAGRIQILDVTGANTGQGQPVVDIDAPTQSFGASSPVFDDGILYVAGGLLHALDVEGTVTDGSAAFAWQQAGYGGSAGSNPVVYGSTVYVGSSDTQVYAVSSSDGSIRWQASDPDDAVAATPAVTGNRVVVGSLDQTLYVLERATGAVVGQTQLDAPVRSDPVVRNGTVSVGTEDGTVLNLGNLP